MPKEPQPDVEHAQYIGLEHFRAPDADDGSTQTQEVVVRKERGLLGIGLTAVVAMSVMIAFTVSMISVRVNDLDRVIDEVSNAQEGNRSTHMMLQYANIISRYQLQNLREASLREAQLSSILSDINVDDLVSVEEQAWYEAATRTVLSGLRVVMGKDELQESRNLFNDPQLYRAYIQERQKQFKPAMGNFYDFLESNRDDLSHEQIMFLGLHIGYLFAMTCHEDKAIEILSKIATDPFLMPASIKEQDNPTRQIAAQLVNVITLLQGLREDVRAENAEAKRLLDADPNATAFQRANLDLDLAAALQRLGDCEAAEISAKYFESGDENVAARAKLIAGLSAEDRGDQATASRLFDEVQRGGTEFATDAAIRLITRNEILGINDEIILDDETRESFEEEVTQYTRQNDAPSVAGTETARYAQDIATSISENRAAVAQPATTLAQGSATTDLVSSIDTPRAEPTTPPPVDGGVAETPEVTPPEPATVEPTQPPPPVEPETTRPPVDNTPPPPIEPDTPVTQPEPDRPTVDTTLDAIAESQTQRNAEACIMDYGTMLIERNNQARIREGEFGGKVYETDMVLYHRTEDPNLNSQIVRVDSFAVTEQGCVRNLGLPSFRPESEFNDLVEVPVRIESTNGCPTCAASPNVPEFREIRPYQSSRFQAP